MWVRDDRSAFSHVQGSVANVSDRVALSYIGAMVQARYLIAHGFLDYYKDQIIEGMDGDSFDLLRAFGASNVEWDGHELGLGATDYQRCRKISQAVMLYVLSPDESREVMMEALGEEWASLLLEGLQTADKFITEHEPHITGLAELLVNAPDTRLSCEQVVAFWATRKGQ